MADIDERISKIEIDLSAVKEKVNFFSVIYDKFDATLEKIEQNTEDYKKETNKELKEVYRRIECVESSIMEEISKLRHDMRKQHEEEQRKISEIDKWRWILVGGATVVGWFISKAIGLFKIGV